MSDDKQPKPSDDDPDKHLQLDADWKGVLRKLSEAPPLLSEEDDDPLEEEDDEDSET